MVPCLIALGSNRGDRQRFLDAAFLALESSPQIAELKRGKTIQSLPIGGPDGQGNFFNSSATFQTNLEPQSLLSLLQAIEDDLGRVKTERWDERVIDLDLILYGTHRLASDTLIVPHPRFAFRRFVLDTAAELAPDMLDPVTGLSLDQLRRRLQSRPHWIAVTGGVIDEVDETVSRIVAKAASQAGITSVCKNSVAIDRIPSLIARERARVLTDYWSVEIGQPTLIVVVESPQAPCESIKAQAESCRIPWLAVSNDDEEWAVREILAAFEAME